MMSVARLARIIVLLTLSAGLCACSAVKLGYNTLDTVAYWWFDRYVDFSERQAPLVRQDLARLHAWHRREELPHFVQLLQRMEQLAPGDLRPEQACTFVADFRERLAATANAAEPAAVTLATSLTAEQLQHIRRQYDKNNANYTDDWIRLPREEQIEKRYRQFLDRAETIYGRLDDPQRAALRRDVERSSFDPSHILAQRQRRQRDLLDTLARVREPGVSFDDARRLLRGYLARALTPPDAKARAEQETLIAEGCHHFAVLHNSTTVAQRDAAVRRLRAYQRDLRELSANQ
jgi:hypothetical protein